MSDDTFLRQAIELSASARANGNLPFGAVLVVDGEVRLTAENAIVTTGDVTRHAEIDLVRATAGWDRAVLAGATVYASGKPCPMCTGAIELAGIGRVVFGVDATAIPGFARPVGPTLEVEGPALPEEAAAAHEGYWVTG